MLTISRYRKSGFVNSIHEKIVIKGIWWLPENPANEVVGILTITPDKDIILELTSFFEYQFDKRELLQYKIINGYSRSGGLITLLNNFEIIKKIPMGHGSAYQFFNSDNIVWGQNFESISSIKFKEYHIALPYFNDIFHPFLIDTKFDSNSITYKEKIDYKINLDNDTITISLYCHVRGNAFSYELNQKGIVIINSEKHLEYNDFKLKYLYPIQDFFGFISDSYNHIVSLKAYYLNADELHSSIDIFDTFQHKRNQRKKLEPLLTVSDTQKQLFLDLLSNWIKSYSRLKTVIDLYTDVIYREGSSLKIQFLLLVQSAEYFHTQKISNKMKPLQKRLEELFQESGFLFDEIFSNTEMICKKIKYTRNFYTHYNPKIKHTIAEDDEISLLLLTMLILNKSFILKELGMPQIDIVNSIKSQGYYSQIKKLAIKFNYK